MYKLHCTTLAFPAQSIQDWIVNENMLSLLSPSFAHSSVKRVLHDFHNTQICPIFRIPIVLLPDKCPKMHYWDQMYKIRKKKNKMLTAFEFFCIAENYGMHFKFVMVPIITKPFKLNAHWPKHCSKKLYLFISIRTYK